MIDPSQPYDREARRMRIQMLEFIIGCLTMLAHHVADDPRDPLNPGDWQRLMDTVSTITYWPTQYWKN